MKKKLVLKMLPIVLLFVIGVGIFIYFVTKPEVANHPLFQEGLVVVKKGDKLGYVNKRGDVVIDFRYEDASNFHKGVAVVRLDSKYHIINKKGKILSKEAHDLLRLDQDADLIIYYKNNKYGLMSLKGEVIQSAVFDGISSFSEEMASFIVKSKYGIINKKGKMIVEATYDTIGPYKNGIAKAVKNGKYQYVNKLGELVSNKMFDVAEDFYKEYAIVGTKEEGKLRYSVMDKSGNFVFKGYDFISRSKNCFVVEKDGVYSILTMNKKSIKLSSDYKGVEGAVLYGGIYLDYFVADYYDAGQNRYKIILNEKGDEVFRTKQTGWGLVPDVVVDDYTLKLYTIVYMTNDESKTTLRVHDSKKEVLTYVGKDLRGDVYVLGGNTQVLKEMIVLHKDGKFGVIDFHGNTIVDFKYDLIFMYSDGYAVVNLDQKYGIVDFKGNIILPVEYDGVK